MDPWPIGVRPVMHGAQLRSMQSHFIQSNVASHAFHMAHDSPCMQIYVGHAWHMATSMVHAPIHTQVVYGGLVCSSRMVQG